ncbi:molybdopterin-dependent oxidoreductase [Halorarius litoreus]|uniref:molybdopterin-dependent oxidoreductase n=1 Tax=Halorarius litoreus TaxID=2962676 RepID=UPI0020CD40C8|nr:molybdopterin-dependent oxidoreductase [Halorarius litoreus]
MHSVRPRLPSALVDWSLLLGVALAVASGLVSLVSGSPGDAWLFVLHGGAGVSLVAFLALKLWRVRHRVRAGVQTRSGTVALSVGLSLLAVAALATGILWVLGTSIPGPWTLLVVHGALGVVTAAVLLVHLRDRLAIPSRATLGERRAALSWLGLVTLGAAAYRANDALGTERRFTGSREAGSDAGNRFPVTMWVADDPAPVDPETWSLTVTGLVDRDLELAYETLDTEAETRALLDCTSGWYSDHDWQGLRVGDLLDAAGVQEGARWVQFRSVTGYRWSLPIAEARGALLAARVDGDRLTHGHGFPLRLVAPERRGFQWVKWVEEVRVTRRRDRSEWIAIHVSGLGE